MKHHKWHYIKGFGRRYGREMYIGKVGRCGTRGICINNISFVNCKKCLSLLKKKGIVK